ncbi:MAG: peptidase S8 and S53, subtilisin, kexin, sedolisin [Candidatus Uhrbacteria bacterium GW2011_GWE2_40_58]|nr:MAG: peptidase S8 and S53, subtilisin, kexin, sedolisin [Candidatus Uhrbacteria bacterium GW2011_GWF2_40_263]KKR67682.1 MAG: peptidase S8 and S53, subtilisin, kexin, sedolisin [Candidatus Uhrbacteria bacterium GW2011_GWE2_40_58]OGL94111.1 MAG: hypothetical protein A2239_02620 [Candidatus Uhrbacteria bacterium RIFOXYA2_FULL_40_9]OGL96573.1 MAG: hypothetical protein A2332_00055 [Candidatus Uhrbacteria bacterium RIFOXYB2_FULL_41_18]HBK35322.1 hypothetical protein [Candidatus Uhrbacteria bacteri
MKQIFSFFLLFCSFVQPAFALSPNDPFLDSLWYLDHIGVPEAWETTTGSSEVIVAVLDSGVDFDHPDLADNSWVNKKEIPEDGIDNDGNGYIDDVYGWDFVHEDNMPIPDVGLGFEEDAVSHGTFIAGTIGAVGNNTEGIVGINWSVKIMSLRVLDNYGVGDSEAVRKAIEYATTNGADVINLSFAGYDYSERFQEAVEKAYEAGVVTVAAVGNDSDGGLNINHYPSYPACFTNGAGSDDWVIGVAATQEDDTKAIFSNYGSYCTDISAPGTDFYSTFFQDDEWLEFSEEYYHGYWSGTSMAVPVVSGAVALLIAEYPTLTPSQIKIILQLSVDPVVQIGIVGRREMGAGRINVARAFSIAGQFGLSREELESVKPSTNIVVVPEAGSPPMVRVFSKNGLLLTEFLAYDEAFSGGVRVAMGDIDADGEDEIVTVPGKGGSPLVRLFEQDGTLIREFYAFREDLQTGFFVAVGDVNGDYREDIVVCADAGGRGRVKVFTQEGTGIEDLWPFGSTEISVRVTTADVDGDGLEEIVCSQGGGTSPLVRVLELDGTLVSEFYAYATTYDQGVFVAAGDIDGDGSDEIVTGTDEGGGPQVQIFNGTGSWIGTFFAYDDQFRGGVRVTVGNLSEEKNASASIITAAGPGGGPHLQIYNNHAELIGTFFTDQETDRQGINVSTWSL